MELDLIAQTESVFALSNGHIGLRGNLDEGEPHGIPGTYLAGFHERRPLPYAEAGYGYPEAGQSVVDVTNGKLLRLLVDDEPFDVRYGELRSHERVLDLRDGVVRRRVEWISPAGRGVRITSTRLVSFAQRAIAAVLYEVEPLDEGLRVVVQSELVANEELPLLQGDPRTGATLPAPLLERADAARGARGGLVHATRHTGQCIAAVMDHVVDGPSSTLVQSESFPHLARTSVMVRLEPGERLRLVKFVAYSWSGSRSSAAVRDQADAALGQAAKTGWDGLLGEQRAYLDDFWDKADVELDGDAEVQQAVRFGLFHVLQAGARAEGRAIPAKGLTGPGYNGHAFWDSETFVLPVLTYTVPEAAAHALRWRQDTLSPAKDRAAQLGLAGAAFPWRTIAGAECSSYWPAGTAAFHIGADIANAVTRYLSATGDAEFERAVGLELLTETARLWSSLGHHDAQGQFRIDGVTGPDEYSAVADNNVYTNLMAQHNLHAAADAAERHPDAARELGVDEEETASWRDAAKAMYVPYDEALGVHPQSEGFTAHEPWAFAATTPEQYPLLLHFPYFDLYRKQVTKQADLVLAMHLRGDAFTAEQKARNFAYYERLTVRDSSLSACTQAVVAAEVGHAQLAHDYLAEAALMDMDDLEHNTRDGLHIASLAGAWIALVAGFGGLREQANTLAFAPSLPPALTRLGFTVAFRNRRLHVEVTPASVAYQLRAGEPLQIVHEGKPVTVTTQRALTCALTQRPDVEPITQPSGRAPARRRASDTSL
ncbi:MAG: family 65 glycosyl hydrolase [Actinomycetota bacterium]|nr:family 65 glycosyl hydrolase [Actinomycetota bacterium]